MNKPGVYVLYGKNDECLYVGSSRHMEYRVKHHEHKKYGSYVLNSLTEGGINRVRSSCR